MLRVRVSPIISENNKKNINYTNNVSTGYGLIKFLSAFNSSNFPNQLIEQFNSDYNNSPSGSHIAHCKKGCGMDGSDIINNYIPDFNSLLSHVEGLDKYPLNLLQDMNILNISAISLLFIVLNVFIAIHVTQNKIDIFKFLPKWLEKTNKLGSIINYLFNRYINLWYLSRVFILIYCWVMLLICLIINQTGFLIILNSG